MLIDLLDILLYEVPVQIFCPIFEGFFFPLLLICKHSLKSLDVSILLNIGTEDIFFQNVGSPLVTSLKTMI